MVDIQAEDKKTLFNIPLKLNKTQVLRLKKFHNLSNSVDDTVAIKSLILSIANNSIRKIGY